jgi:hypothetical protein
MDADRIRSAWPSLPSRVKDALVTLCLGRVEVLEGISATWTGFGIIADALTMESVGFELATVPVSSRAWVTIGRKTHPRAGKTAPDALSLAFVLSRAERIPEEFPLGVEP